jgi:D-serine deaminase-like pyridoxal phosphate-dependent protein
MKQDYSYYNNILKDRDFPLAFVDLDLLDENIQSVLTRSKEKKIRIATKSIRCISLIRYITQKNARFQGLMCFTAPEAVFLVEQGFDDILIGYPVAGIEQIKNVCKKIKEGKTIIFMVDSEDHLKLINNEASALGITAPVCIDADMSVSFPGLHFGVFRSPVNNVEKTDDLIDKLLQYKNLKIDGLMGYEAQIAGVTDNAPGQFLQNIIINKLKQKSIKEIAKRRSSILKAIEKKGIQLRFVNGGGTGSLENTSLENAVTEITAGSGFFSPGLFDHYKNFKHKPAAAFALQIVRQPKKNIFTCLGGGYIASGSAGKEKLPVPYLPSGIRLLKNEGAGEVQTPFEYKGNLKTGDMVFFRHSKAGELCERFNELVLIRKGEITETVPTYRGEGKCFL